MIVAHVEAMHRVRDCSHFCSCDLDFGNPEQTWTAAL